MFDWSMHRRFARYRISLPIIHRSMPTGVSVGVGWTQNLSEGGACIELPEQLWPETPLQLCLQADQGHLELEARVAWAGKPDLDNGCTLHGLSFTQLTPEQLQALQELLQSGEQIPQAVVRLPVAIPVTFRPKGQSGPSLHGRTGEIGSGGLLLRLLRAYPPGMTLEVTLHTSKGPLTAEGTIAWVAPPDRRRPGELIPHGVQFTNFDWATSLSLDLVLAETV